MPIYEYLCESCKKIHEIMQGFNDKPIKNCPDCKGPVRKLISNNAFILKGSGWYKTDYESPEGKKALEPERSKPTENIPPK